VDRKIFDSVPLDNDRFLVLETACSISAELHMREILKKIRKQGIRDTAQIMTLFHDDWLIRAPGEIELESSSVLAGDWITDQSRVSNSAIEGSSQEVRTWLEGGHFRNIFTNGSGMIAPLAVRESAIRMLSLFRTGVRSEYLVLTHRNIRTIEKVSLPLVRIRIHAGQDGRNQSVSSSFRGDVAFFIWLFLEGRVVSRRGFAVACSVLFSGLHSALLGSLREIGSNFRLDR